MKLLFTRRAVLRGFVVALLAALMAPPAAARHWWPPFLNRNTVIVRGTLTAIDTAAGTVQVTDRNGLSVTLRTNTSTVIRRDGRTATLADLRTDDAVLATFDRTTMVASRIEAATPPPVRLDGTITALDAAAGTIQVTTDHGTTASLTVNADTRIRLNGRATTLSNLVIGQEARVTYRPEARVALTLDATTPPPGVVTGAVTGIDATALTLQITPLAGSPRNLRLSPETQFRLNGRRVSASAITVGLLAAVEVGANDTARVVNAVTPPLVDLPGTISALDVAGGTFQVTTPGATTITLRLTPQTAIQRNDAPATPDQLAIGDQVVVRYEYLLIPGQSRAIRIVARSAPAPPPTGVTVTGISFNPASVAGGSPSTGTVTVSGAAPAGGVTVTLTSSNTAVATVPATVTVAEGATSATFPVTTTAVTADTPVTITATLGAASMPANLTVTPATPPV